MRKATFTKYSAAAVLIFAVMLSACSDEQPTVVQRVEPPAPIAATTAPVNPSTVPVATTAPTPEPAPIGATSSNLSPEALETLLAPIALYPDPILAQVLASSLNPQEVLDAGNWLIANPDMKGKELDTAATALGFTPPMISLMHFPSVVDMMCMEMDWTTELGAAFQADEPGVLAAVQRLRKQAAEMGNLTSSEQMKVTTEEQNSEQVIVVEPANPEVVYVPQYNPTAAYTTPAPATTTVVQETDDGYSGGEMVAAGLLAFGAGMLVNEVFDDDGDDYDYYRPNWGYDGSGYYPPPYRPRYGNGYRPANRYNRPVNYERGFNNNNIYVDADGKDFFNKFDGGRNSYRKNAKSPISAARPNRPELGGLNQRAQSGQRPATLGQGDGRKVQGNYAGAKPNARPDMPAQRPTAITKVPKGTYAGAANPAARQKLNPQTAGARDRGRTAAPAAIPALAQQRASKLSAPATATRKVAPKRTSGFEGVRNSGKQERAASQRGRASKSHSANRPERSKSGQQRGKNR